MSRQQIPVVCYDKNHYIYPANLLVISRLAKLFMHRILLGLYMYCWLSCSLFLPAFRMPPSLSEKLLLPTGNSISCVWPILPVPTVILRSARK